MRNTFPRVLNIPTRQSFFLFGARGTGKSSLLKSYFDPAAVHWIDLLDTLTEDKFAKFPAAFRAEILALPPNIKHCVVDEIQKIPKLLDAVHLLMETDKSNIQFALTGSSARKLKAGGANLLAGRAILRSLYPLTLAELGAAFDLSFYLSWGGLPQVWNLQNDSEIRDYLKTYTSVYLKEEVWAEQLVRSMEPFRRFLEVAAQCSGKILNFRNIGKDTGVDPKTIPNWYSVLKDTLVGFYLDAFDTSVRRQMRKSAKFYLFDVGVTRSLTSMLTYPPVPGTSYYGELFEQFIVTQVYFLNDYRQLDYRLSYLRTKAGVEIDLVIQRPGRSLLFVEIKSKSSVDERDTKHLQHMSAEFSDAEFVVVSQDRTTQKYGVCLCVHFENFLKEFGRQP